VCGSGLCYEKKLIKEFPKNMEVCVCVCVFAMNYPVLPKVLKSQPSPQEVHAMTLKVPVI